MANKDVTTGELLDFMKENMATKHDLKELKNELRDEMGGMEHRILDSMDDKLADLKGDLVIMMRKEDTKVTELIKILAAKEVLSADEATSLRSMEPFPQR
ncbi:MAG TPA: hypothetical protein QF873_00570 [Patescibacteria group bacterium]|nr:hypothetical protein [Patescibacteria group bacterium]